MTAKNPPPEQHTTGPCGAPSPNLFRGIPADPPCIRTAGHDGPHHSSNCATWPAAASAPTTTSNGGD